MSSNARRVLIAARGVTSQMLSGLAMLPEVLFVVVGTLVRVIPAAQAGFDAFARWLADFHRWRLVAYLNYDDHLYKVPDWRRMYAYVLRRLVIGVIGSTIVGLIAIGVASAGIMGWQVVRNRPIGGESSDGGLSSGGNTLAEVVAIGAVGLVLFFGAVWGLIGVAVLERRLADQYLVPTEAERLLRRVTELEDTRAAVVSAVNDERRRIERDLHDGVQQRLVALGMLLGRAVRAKEPDHAKKLLVQAHEESQQALIDLREVTWRVYPTALDRDGLHAALEGVADRASVPVQVHYELAERPDLETETVLYFVASEAVTNALKHGDPTRIKITVERRETTITLMVHDDGRGGADMTGSGLSGLKSRVEAADGTFGAISPPGGPTLVVARLPAAPGIDYDIPTAWIAISDHGDVSDNMEGDRASGRWTRAGDPR
jgi:signal transduction histidine kinase